MMASLYFERDGIQIWHGDCREVLPGLAADVVVTDPPYGVGIDRQFRDELALGILGTDAAPGKRLAAFMSPRRVPEFVNGLPSWRFERLLWLNKVADIAYPWRGWHMNGEAIVIASRTRAEWPPATTTRTDVYSVPFSGGKNGHPAAKPLAVVSDLVSRLSTSADVVIDPFVGSGTTLVAAASLGRRAIGIEIEERYCEIAARRLDQMAMNLEVPA